MQLTTEWDKTFVKSDQVQHQKVTFKNRYGITLAGDLYLPKERAVNPLPALAVSGPYGAVKEQASGIYAQTMAERGYATLAFDPSFTGESGGEPRNISSPEINTEDFSAAVDFLGLHEVVDQDRIGVIGICGFGGMSLNAAAADTRIKAMVTTSMYDMSRVMSKGYFDSMTKEERLNALEQMNQLRWEDAKSGQPTMAPQGLPEPSALTGEEPPFVTEYVDYYRTSRGFHPRSINSNGSWAATTALSFMNMPLLSYIGDIAPRPLLLIAGENAHSRYFSEDASKAAGDNAELLVLDGLVHVDLYDRPEHIPFARIDKFFSEHLA
ncbi:membrane protein [Vibrio tubiashii]|nr:membrane protein [Vibrio tubiashii]